MSGETRPGVNLTDFNSLWFRPEGRVKAQHHKKANKQNNPKALKYSFALKCEHP